MRVVRSSVVKPFIGELSAVTGSDREDAVYQAASKGFDYFAEGDLLADDNQYTVFAYNRTRDAEKAIRCVAALRTSDAKSKSVKINGVTYKKASGTVKDKKTPYVLYTTTDGKAGNPIIDARVGEDAALSDCPMSVWLRGYYGSQMDLTSIYAKSEELYTALEKDNTIYTMLPVVLTDPNAKAQQGTTAAAEGVSPFVIKGNGPTTINVIGSGTSEFEANGTGVFYAANNIKVTLNIIKTDAKAEVFMKNSATRLQAVSCGPYSGKVSSTTKTESGEFYTYSSGSITKKEEGTFNLTGGSVFMNPEGVTQTQRKLYWYYGGVAARGTFDTAYMSKTTPAIKYSSLLTLKGSLTKDSMLLIDTGVRKTHESEFSILLSAASFTSTTDSSPIIVTGKNDAVINLFYSGKNTLSFSKEVPLVDVRTDNRNKVRVNLIKTDNKAQIQNNGQAFAGLNSLLPLELNSEEIRDKASKVISVETEVGKGKYTSDEAGKDNGGLIVEDGIVFTPEGFTSGTSSTAYIDSKREAEVHAANEPYKISAQNADKMKNPLVFYNNNTEPVEFTLNITDPSSVYKANKSTPTIVACGKSAVILNIVCSEKCSFQNDELTVLVKDGIDLVINEKRSGSGGKLTVSGSGVTDGGVYSLNLADEKTTSNKLNVKLTCTNDAGGWNSGSIPAELRDSAGNTYKNWTVERKYLDDEKDSTSYTYDIGNNLPTMLILKPNFGGGMTFRDYKVRLEAKLNGKTILNQERESRSYPFSSSGNMVFNFSETGFARVAVADSNGTYSWKNYDNIRSAWKAAQESRGVGLIQLTSTWLLDSRLILGNNKKVKIDLGGYIIRRNLNDLKSDGEVIKVNSGAVLDIIDTCPDRISYVGFRGGGIVGGRSNNGGGNIHIGGGTLNMTGGHIYDGQCNEDGGGIYLDNDSATLKNVTISNCQAMANADKARMWEYIGAGVSIGFGLMAIAGGIMKIIDLANYYEPEYDEIQRYIVDEKDITKEDENGNTIVLHNDFAYYKVVTCNRKAKGTSGDSNHNWWTSGAKTNVDKYTQWGCGDYGDLNGDVGKGWPALYTETNPEHDPIEAGTFVVKFNDEVPSGYDHAIHLFGSSAAVNLNSSRWDFNADITYVYYKTDHIHTFTHGDVNNDGMIDIKDATEIQRYAAQFIELDSTALAAADVSGDGNVTIADATKIQRCIAKLINELVTVST